MARVQRKQQRLNGRFVAILVGSFLAAGLFVVATGTLSTLADSVRRIVTTGDIESELPTTTMDETVQASGVTMRLTEVEPSSDAMILRIELGLVDEEATSDTFLPILPDRMEVTGVEGDPAQFGQITQYPPSEGVIPVGVRVGPPADPAGDVTVTVNEIGVLQSTDPAEYEWIDGPWQFTIHPQDFASDPIDVTIPIEQTLTQGEVSITIFDVHLSSRAVSVRYDVDGIQEGKIIPADTEIQLVLPDGRTFKGQGEGGVIDPSESLALFPALPAGTTTFDLAFGSYVAPEAEQVEVTFAVPEGIVVAKEDVPSSEEIVAPVHETLSIAGERLEVTEMMLTGDDIAIEVVNTEPLGDATILFVGPDTKGQTLTDNLGNEYPALGGHFGFRKDDQGNLSAGASGIRFKGPLAVGASSLTLRVDSFGRMIPGPDAITVDVPIQ